MRGHIHQSCWELEAALELRCKERKKLFLLFLLIQTLTASAGNAGGIGAWSRLRLGFVFYGFLSSWERKSSLGTPWMKPKG